MSGRSCLCCSECVSSLVGACDDNDSSEVDTRFGPACCLSAGCLMLQEGAVNGSGQENGVHASWLRVFQEQRFHSGQEVQWHPRGTPFLLPLSKSQGYLPHCLHNLLLILMMIIIDTVLKLLPYALESTARRRRSPCLNSGPWPSHYKPRLWV